FRRVLFRSLDQRIDTDEGEEAAEDKTECAVRAADRRGAVRPNIDGGIDRLLAHLCRSIAVEKIDSVPFAAECCTHSRGRPRPLRSEERRVGMLPKSSVRDHL